MPRKSSASATEEATVSTTRRVLRSRGGSNVSESGPSTQTDVSNSPSSTKTTEQPSTRGKSSRKGKASKAQETDVTHSEPGPVKESKNELVSNENQIKSINQIPIRRVFDWQSQNLVHYLNRADKGVKPTLKMENSLKHPIVENLRKLEVYKTASPFDRRATALAWHPRYLSTVAVGSKGGDIVLWNYEQSKPVNFVMGQGPGGSIQAMKFDNRDYNRLYTVSIDGTMCSRDLMGTDTVVFLDTETRHQWFTALDVSFNAGVVVAGDNRGVLHLLTKEGNPVSKRKIFSQKVTHAEFSTREPWLLATASLDACIKLWDIRKIDSKASPLAQLPHEKPINSAYFSLSHGTRILTTDQHSRINIYKGPLWDLETSIAHPHRRFQHLTPIKAYWHPLEDIVVVGRYPDPAFPGYYPKEPRTVDFFDAATGDLLYQVQPRGHEGIISLNRFDHVGSALCSLMGQHILIWKPRFAETGEEESNTKDFDWKVPKRPHNGDDEDDDLKKKKRRNTQAKYKQESKTSR